MRGIVAAPAGSGKSFFVKQSNIPCFSDLDDYFDYGGPNSRFVTAPVASAQAIDHFNRWKNEGKEFGVGFTAELASPDVLVLPSWEVHKSNLRKRGGFSSTIAGFAAARAQRGMFRLYALVHGTPIFETFEDAMNSMRAKGLQLQSNLGVDVDTEQPVVVVGDSSGPSGQDNGLSNETQWSVPDMVKRRQFIAKLDWPLDAFAGDTIATYEHPWDFLRVPITSVPFDRMTYARTDINLIFKCQATAFHQGKAICYFVPLTRDGSEDATFIQSNKTSQTVNPHVFLDPASTDEVVLRIPYKHWKSHLTVTDRFNVDILGTFYVQVFNQLRSGPETVDGAVINVFVEFQNSEFVIPSVTPVAPAPVAHRRGLMLQGNSVVKTSNINIERVVDSTLGPMASSDGFRASNEVTPTVAVSVPMGGGDATSSASNASSGTGSKKKRKKGKTLMDNDKPRIGLNPVQLVRRPMPYMAHAQNVDYLNYLSYVPGEEDMLSMHSMSVQCDEMADSYLLEKPTYDRTLVWEVDDLHGSILWSDFIAPCTQLFSAAPGDTLSTPLVDFMTARHTFWRGSLVYEFDVVGSRIHTGQLALCINYGTFEDPPDLELAMSQYVAIFDLAGESRTFRVEIPYRSTREFMYVPNGVPDFIENYALGRVSLRVINDLRAMDSVAQSVEINVFKSGGPDYDVLRPSAVNSSLGLVLQGADTPLTEAVIGEEETVALATGSPELAGPSATLPSYVTTIKDEMKRYFLCGIMTAESPLAVIDVARVFDQTDPSDFTSWRGIVFEKCGLLSFYSNLYRYYSGSLRFVIVYDDPSASAPIGITFSMRPGGLLIGDNILNPVSDFGTVAPYDLSFAQEHFSAVEVPFTSINPFTMLRDKSVQGAGYCGTIQVTKAVGFSAKLYVAFGDQTRFATLYKVPRFQVAPVNIHPDTYGSGSTYVIAATIIINHDPTAPLWASGLFTDATWLSSVQVPVAFGESTASQVVYATSTLANIALTSLGYPVNESTNIIVAPGTVDTVTANLSLTLFRPPTRVYTVAPGGEYAGPSGSIWTANVGTSTGDIINYESYEIVNGTNTVNDEVFHSPDVVPPYTSKQVLDIDPGPVAVTIWDNDMSPLDKAYYRCPVDVTAPVVGFAEGFGVV